MADRLVPIADGFWNIRGSFKIFGFLDIGTQASLVRLRSGGFVLLDSYTLSGDVEDEVRALTDGGQAIEAILNLHPFHTVHVKRVAAQFPDAKLYGTRRHVDKAPDLRWEALHTEDPAVNELYPDDLFFSVPAGVDFIPDNENLHFASVLAFHTPSKTLHVDDTLVWTSLPFIGGLSFHPTLKRVLQPRAGAAAEFRAWAEELVRRCEDVEHLCTAHTKRLPPSDGQTVAERVRGALGSVDKKLRKHEARYG